MLTPQEVKDLFETLRRMVEEGHSLIFISHKLYEVMAISDRVTVLRDGKVIGTRLTSDVTRDELVKMMVGREVKEIEARPLTPGPSRLRSRVFARWAIAAPRRSRTSIWKYTRERSSVWPGSRATVSANSPNASRA